MDDMPCEVLDREAVPRGAAPFPGPRADVRRCGAVRERVPERATQADRSGRAGCAFPAWSRPDRVREGPAAVDPVAALLAGRPAPADVAAGLAPWYLVAVLRLVPGDGADPASDDGAGVVDLFARSRPRPLVAPAPDGSPADLVALVPCREELRVRRAVDCLGRRLSGRAWCGVAVRGRDEIPAGYREAVEVLELARSTAGAPGVYHREDLLVEYAVTRDAAIADELAAIVEPLMSQTVLRDTLRALIGADYNRSRAARDLFIHRSTLDYRLRQIENITGQHPGTGRGARLLGAALAAYAARRSD